MKAHSSTILLNFALLLNLFASFFVKVVSIQHASASGTYHEVETRTLDEIYAAALKEGGTLTIYAGGHSEQFVSLRKKAFEAQFPGIRANFIVDLNRALSVRIDGELKMNTLEADLTHLQSMHQFPRWKDAGVLHNYKPIHWNHIYPQIKDADGAFTGIYFIIFGITVNSKVLPNKSEWPKNAMDLFHPEFHGKIVGSHPEDDDASLYWYKLMVEKHGWNFMERLVAQNITFVKGETKPKGEALDASIIISTGPPFDRKSPVTFLFELNEPFASWAETAAIFKSSKHQEAAKLYVNWLLDDSFQSRLPQMYTVRDDLSPGSKTIWELPNTDPMEFGNFMLNAKIIEEFKIKMRKYVVGHEEKE